MDSRGGPSRREDQSSTRKSKPCYDESLRYSTRRNEDQDEDYDLTVPQQLPQLHRKKSRETTASSLFKSAVNKLHSINDFIKSKQNQVPRKQEPIKEYAFPADFGQRPEDRLCDPHATEHVSHGSRGVRQQPVQQHAYVYDQSVYSEWPPKQLHRVPSMTRFLHQATQDHSMWPHGMQEIRYDDDRWFYRDDRGFVYASGEGCRYGTVRRVNSMDPNTGRPKPYNW